MTSSSGNAEPRLLREKEQEQQETQTNPPVSRALEMAPFRALLNPLGLLIDSMAIPPTLYEYSPACCFETSDAPFALLSTRVMHAQRVLCK